MEGGQGEFETHHEGEGDPGLQHNPGDGGVPEFHREPMRADIYNSITSGGPSCARAKASQHPWNGDMTRPPT